MNMMDPPHAGIFIRREIIEPLELSVTEAAEILGVGRQALSALLNGRASLSPDMAIRIGKAFDVNMKTLLKIQHQWDIAQADERADEIDVEPYDPPEDVAYRLDEFNDD